MGQMRVQDQIANYMLSDPGPPKSQIYIRQSKLKGFRQNINLTVNFLGKQTLLLHLEVCIRHQDLYIIMGV